MNIYLDIWKLYLKNLGCYNKPQFKFEVVMTKHLTLFLAFFQLFLVMI